MVGAILSGDLEAVFGDLGVCEITAGPAAECIAELEEDQVEVEPDVRKALRSAKTTYGVHAPIGSPAQWTAELQDALFEALAADEDAVTEIDGEFQLGVGDDEDDDDEEDDSPLLDL